MQILLLYSHTTSKPLQGPHFIWTALPLLPKGCSAPNTIVLDLPSFSNPFSHPQTHKDTPPALLSDVWSHSRGVDLALTPPRRVWHCREALTQLH